MAPANFSDTICGKALSNAKFTIWRFFITICFILLAFLLSNPAEEVAVAMKELNCTGLLLSGTFIASALFAIDNMVGVRGQLSWGELIGYVAGLATSIVILEVNESTLQQIGTSSANTFILHFAIAYFAICAANVAGLIVWDHITTNREN